MLACGQMLTVYSVGRLLQLSSLSCQSSADAETVIKHASCCKQPHANKLLIAGTVEIANLHIAAQGMTLKIHYDTSTIIAVLAYGLAVKCPKHSQGDRQLHRGIGWQRCLSKLMRLPSTHYLPLTFH